MKILYLVGSIIGFVIILILSFENVQASCTYLTFFFWELSASVAPTFVLFGSALLGIVTGSFMTLLAVSLFSGGDDDDDDYDFEA